MSTPVSRIHWINVWPFILELFFVCLLVCFVGGIELRGTFFTTKLYPQSFQSFLFFILRQGLTKLFRAELSCWGWLWIWDPLASASRVTMISVYTLCVEILLLTFLREWQSSVIILSWSMHIYWITGKISGMGLKLGC